MSLLFNLVAKLFVKEDDYARFCSHPRETPYMLINYNYEENEYTNREDYLNEEVKTFTDYCVFNPRSEKLINIKGKRFPRGLSYGCWLLGTSRGWSAFSNLTDFSIHLTQVFNPWSLDSHKTIDLPPFADNLSFHSPRIINVSLSTPFPHQDKDYIVCVAFFGSKLSYCMPNRDSEWTTINIPFCYHTNSHVVYSMTHQMFYLLAMGCAYMVALDLKNNNNNPNFLKLDFENLSSIRIQEWEILASCVRSDYIVESFSGQRFIVQWYIEPNEILDMPRVLEETKRFMVFKIEEGRRIIAKYTEDIGDLCIFIGRNETFCLEASKYPGLRPNSIYYACYGFGLYDISNRSNRDYDLSNFPTTFLQCVFLDPSIH
ncbi:unnamed protein product [Cochlearia groenlandica]